MYSNWTGRKEVEIWCDHHYTDPTSSVLELEFLWGGGGYVWSSLNISLLPDCFSAVFSALFGCHEQFCSVGLDLIVGSREMSLPS